jgi:hypothetical protein
MGSFGWEDADSLAKGYRLELQASRLVSPL